MPYKIEKIKLDRDTQDRRVKIPLILHPEIIRKYEAGASQRALARKYNCSRSLIRFIVMPEKLQRARELFRERQKDGRYYNRERHSEQVRNMRHYKQSLHLRGEL